ncbi:MAG: acetate--CoA ligase family protein [Myxococcales bacterium]|nr:acetate--CoA ligase family protein [Myxococcales bacterium]
MSVRIVCDSPELAVECLEGARAIGLASEPSAAENWLAEAAAALARDPIVAAVIADRVTLSQLVELAHAARQSRSRAAIALVSSEPDTERLRDAALDLGITALPEVDPLLSALALLQAGARSPWAASIRALPTLDRGRLRLSMGQGARTGGQLQRAEGGHIHWRDDAEAEGVDVGRARDLAPALSALRETDTRTPRIESSVDGVDGAAVLDVLFGPRRALSDPASKNALEPYGIPLPLEELCASPSRAASEASRIGYPVRISLASPDLRLWDHPDLAIDMVDNAARVRDSYRQLIGVAKARLEPDSEAERILGVMVTATSEPRAQLGAHAWPLPHGRVALELGFADAHGAAAGDATLTVLPAPLASIERALRRLAGSALLLSGTAATRRTHVDAIGDVLLRLSAFVNDRREELESVELRPIALLLDGTVEVREARVQVSDAFERSLRTGSG